MKTLISKITTTVASRIQKQTFIYELQFNIGTLRICSRGTQEWNGLSWGRAGVSAPQINTGVAAMQSGSFTVLNKDWTFSQLIIGSSGDIGLNIWKLFGAPPYAFEDAENLVKDAVITELPDLGPRMTFPFASKGARTKRVPNLFVGAPGFNHTPKPGQKFVWNNTEFEIGSRRG